MYREQYGEFAYRCYGMKGKFTLKDVNDLPSVRRLLTSNPVKDSTFVIVVINPSETEEFKSLFARM